MVGLFRRSKDAAGWFCVPPATPSFITYHRVAAISSRFSRRYHRFPVTILSSPHSTRAVAARGPRRLPYSRYANSVLFAAVNISAAGATAGAWRQHINGRAGRLADGWRRRAGVAAAWMRCSPPFPLCRVGASHQWAFAVPYGRCVATGCVCLLRIQKGCCCRAALLHRSLPRRRVPILLVVLPVVSLG